MSNFASSMGRSFRSNQRQTTSRNQDIDSDGDDSALMQLDEDNISGLMSPDQMIQSSSEFKLPASLQSTSNNRTTTFHEIAEELLSPTQGGSSLERARKRRSSTRAGDQFRSIAQQYEVLAGFHILDDSDEDDSNENMTRRAAARPTRSQSISDGAATASNPDNRETSGLTELRQTRSAPFPAGLDRFCQVADYNHDDDDEWPSYQGSTASQELDGTLFTQETADTLVSPEEGSFQPPIMDRRISTASALSNVSDASAQQLFRAISNHYHTQADDGEDEDEGDYDINTYSDDQMAYSNAALYEQHEEEYSQQDYSLTDTEASWAQQQTRMSTTDYSSSLHNTTTRPISPNHYSLPIIPQVDQALRSHFSSSPVNESTLFSAQSSESSDEIAATLFSESMAESMPLFIDRMPGMARHDQTTPRNPAAEESNNISPESSNIVPQHQLAADPPPPPGLSRFIPGPSQADYFRQPPPEISDEGELPMFNQASGNLAEFGGTESSAVDNSPTMYPEPSPTSAARAAMPNNLDSGSIFEDDDQSEVSAMPAPPGSLLERQQANLVHTRPGAMAIAGPDSDTPSASSLAKGRLTRNRSSFLRPPPLRNPILRDLTIAEGNTEESGRDDDPVVDSAIPDQQSLEPHPAALYDPDSPNSPEHAPLSTSVPEVSSVTPISAETHESSVEEGTSRESPILDSPPPDADEVDKQVENRLRRRKMLIFGGLAVLIAVVGAIVGIVIALGGSSGAGGASTSSPTSAPTKDVTETRLLLRLQLDDVTDSNSPIWEDSTSAQNSALNWIIQSDSYLEPLDTIAQRYVLAVLYYSTGGDNWASSGRFLSSDRSECDWNEELAGGVIIGVQCDDMGGVSHIRLPANNLNGPLTNELFHLAPSMVAFEAPSNSLSGEAFSVLTQLTNLETIAIANNPGIEGPLPLAIRELSRLKELNFGSCSMTGTFPSDLGQSLPNIISISGPSNRLSGTFPFNSFDEDSPLNKLSLSGNADISGELPLQLPPKLADLEMGNTNLIGGIPATISIAWTSLVRLDLRQSGLSGSIPSQIGDLSNLVYLNLSSNSLNSSIPPEIGRLLALQELELGNSNLSSDLPAAIGNLSQLKRLFVENNGITGNLPSEFGQLVSLEVASFPLTELTGEVGFLCSNPNVQEVFVDAQQSTNCDCCTVPGR